MLLKDIMAIRSEITVNTLFLKVQFLNTKAGDAYVNHVVREFMSFLCQVHTVYMKNFFFQKIR